MVNLAQYNRVDDAFDNLLRGIFMHPVRMREDATDLQIRMDVSEDEKAYTVRAEIPGVKKDDIQVTINGNQVAISAEVKNEKEVKEGEKVLRSERYCGKVARTFALAQDVDEDNAQAKYTDGVLELTLQKKVVAKSKRLMIN